MNRFLYYIPGAPGTNAESLKAIGLASRFVYPGGAVRFSVAGWDAGPHNSGCCVHAGKDIVTYDPDAQLWQDCGAFWIGVDRQLRPGPRDLEREVGYSGYAIALLDGAEWRVPLVRRWNVAKMEMECALPKVMRPYRENGRFGIRAGVSAQHEEIDRLGEQIFSAFCAQAQWQSETLFAAAAMLLAENYRVGVEEVGLLGLLDEALARRVIGLAIDEPALSAAASDLGRDGVVFAEGESNG